MSNEEAALSENRPQWSRFLDTVTGELFKWATVLLATAMTLLIGMDVILRFAIGMPIRGTHDLVGLGLLTLFLVALPHSWRGGYHVRMDMLYSNFSPRLKLVVDVLAGIAAIIFAALLAYQAFRYIPQFMRIGNASVTLRIPYWPFTTAIMVSSILFCLSIVQDLIVSVVYGRDKE